MTRSMTAFARQEAETAWGGLVWEARSVNHRYLEITLRLPDDLRALEVPARTLIANRLERGKLDCTLRFQAGQRADGGIEVDVAQTRRLVDAARLIRAKSPEEVAPLNVADILRWPGVLKAPEIDVKSLNDAALELLSRTLDELVDMRVREGARMERLILDRLNGVEQTVARVQQILPELTPLFRARLEERLKEIRAQLDPNRLEQELVLFAQRIDVAEELDRLGAHVAEVRNVLGGPGQKGRRLDFLMQELNREANTLASKSVDMRVTNAAIELKVLIEQMREQVQNIE